MFLRKKRISEEKTSRTPMKQENKRKRNSEEKREAKGKSSLFLFKALEKKKELNSAHNGTQNITQSAALIGIWRAQERVCWRETLDLYRKCSGRQKTDFAVRSVRSTFDRAV